MSDYTELAGLGSVRYLEWLHEQNMQAKIDGAPPAAIAPVLNGERQTRVLQLINAYRVRAHQCAGWNPLINRGQSSLTELSPQAHGLQPADLDAVFFTGSLVADERMSLRAILDHLRRIYLGPVGCEYMHIVDTAEKRWLQLQLEGGSGYTVSDALLQHRILERLVAAEGLEHYLHRQYVGQKRFSLEGAESLIPLLDQAVQALGAHGVGEVGIGMAHRGRLNVLVNLMGKAPEQLFQEFEGQVSHAGLSTGDVKYHQGFSTDMMTEGRSVHVALAFNPSHLEAVGPVIQGSVRARQHRRDDRHGDQVVPIVLHGDSAFCGQGVIMETFNMSRAPGYTVDGTVHVIINNQIGFTTDPAHARSTEYCSEIAKMVQAPIFHVNADDPEAVVRMMQLAVDYRMRFHKDVVIDLVAYRRHGHNEADEPMMTQPSLYQAIASMPSVVARYAERLRQTGCLGEGELLAMQKRYRQCLGKGERVARDLARTDSISSHYTVNWAAYHGQLNSMPDTGLDVAKLKRLGQELLRLPADWQLHPRVASLYQKRERMMAQGTGLDWGMSELLAYASLLQQGYAVRLSGQDSQRGTFSHRHAVVHDQKTDQCYCALQHLAGDSADAIVLDSPLSENAILAFEYGYATADPHSLVIWEAQYGDFANGAQVLIDQFLTAGEAKWGRLCGMVLYLPHGYEGQGAEHSSARLERWLQLSANDNLRLCQPTRPAQLFHLLRQQMLADWRKPLVVMMPKGLLRYPQSVSCLQDFSEHNFEPVQLHREPTDPTQVSHVVLCSGRVLFDLLAEDLPAQVALLSLEQIAPLPKDDLLHALDRYPQLQSLIWCQQEPANQGAGWWLQPRLQNRFDMPVHCISPAESAAPAMGNLHAHQAQQREWMDRLLAML